MLVILFTDLKGFTELTERRGERYALELLKRHDEILVKAIEEDNGGLVVKHIGDSVMAVFSEPSTAVERALRIQERIRAFNEGNPDGDGLAVRIGVHMGQVAVENQTQLDLFGRHVNRASRVEGIADAGQIYLTYPVFDSARGWLASGTTGSLAWKSHGSWILKGIKEPGRHLRGDRYPLRRIPSPEAQGASAPSPLWAALAILVPGLRSPSAPRRSGARKCGSTTGPTSRPSWTRRRSWCSRALPPTSHGRPSRASAPGSTCCARTSTGRSRKNFMVAEIKRGKNVVENGFQAAWLP